MSFYRTYRPQIIDEIDNLQVRAQLLALLTKDKAQLPHAYLFSGPRGAGKTTAARLVAKLFNCEKPTKNGPCGTCEQCTSIASGQNLDVLEMDAASNRGIEEIRSLRSGIHLAPSSASFKVYIIDEVHMLTTEAFNALLKTLEEPPAHAVFVLATTDSQKVPATIKSRCVQIIFSKAKKDELLHALSRIAKAEKLDIETDALARIGASVDGSFRDGVKLLEQISFHKGKVTVEVVETILSFATTKDVADFLTYLGKGDVKRVLDEIENLVQTGADIKTFIVSCLQLLEDRLITITKGHYDRPEELPFIKRAIVKFSAAYAETRLTAIAQLPLELAVIELCEEQPMATATVKPVGPAKPEKVEAKPQAPVVVEEPHVELGLLTFEKLTEHWRDFIEALKPYNHSVAGVLRSSRPKAVEGGIVVIEAFYKFHQEKLAETKTKEMLTQVLKKLFGEKVKVDIVLGKK